MQEPCSFPHTARGWSLPWMNSHTSSRTWSLADVILSHKTLVSVQPLLIRSVRLYRPPKARGG